MFVSPVKKFTKTLFTAPDKSITHRAVLFNAMAKGHARVTNALLGEDCKASIECMRALGANIEVKGDTVEIESEGVFRNAELYAGNSGTTMRLLAGLLAGKGVSARIDGDESLRMRPMGRVITPLTLMGAKIKSQDGKAPLEIEPSDLVGVTYAMPQASAQVKSAVLLAGINAEGETVVLEKIKSRDHTENMLKRMGANIVVGEGVRVKRSTLHTVDVAVTGDPSSATFLLGAAAITGGRVTVRNVGLNPTRTGAFEVMKRMGAVLTFENYVGGDEPYGDVTLTADGLKAFSICGQEVPSLVDELPMLAVMACYAEGVSVISGAEELKVKESNRLATTTEMINALGGKAEQTDDGIIIYGSKGLRGGKVNSHGDHRIAMSAAVGALGSKEGAEIEGGECIAVSYPDFKEILR